MPPDPKLRPMKVFVTGASGFVGGAVMRRARELGWEVCGVGRRPLPDPGYRSIDLSRPFVFDFSPEVVIHTAARSSPWGRRREFEVQNVDATQQVLDFCATHGRPHLVHISTAAVLYRHEHQLGLEEQCVPPEQPINDYARTKLAAERLVRGYAGTWCILRPRAVFGPGDTVVFPRILRALERGRLPLIQSDRSVLADLVFIDTLADYILRAAERRATGIYHLSNHEPIEIHALLRRLCAELGLPAPTRAVAASRVLRFARALELLHRLLPFLGEPPITEFGASVFAYSKTLDAARALRDLGPPSVSLEAGLERFIAWQRAQPRAID